MAKLMSKKTREIVKTTTVLIIIVLFIGFYIVYPLITVPKLVARPDKDKFDDPEFKYANDASFFVDSGLLPDTLAIATDDNIRLAALYFRPDSNKLDSISGTVIMLHGDNSDRTSLISYISPLLDTGLAVVIYDQRASGFSGGKYHAAGIYEADDLVQLIVDLNFKGMLFPPLTVVGFDLGADAVIFASQKENRIDGVVAINPYLTSSRWISSLVRAKNALAIPLYKMVYFWWYQKLTGFPFDRTGVDDIQPVETRTILIAGQSAFEEDEYLKLMEISPDAVTTVSRAPDSDKEKSRQMILEYILYMAGIPTGTLK